VPVVLGVAAGQVDPVAVPVVPEMGPGVLVQEAEAARLDGRFKRIRAFMLNWITNPRMILLPFAFGLWLLAWSLRFLPRHRLSGAQRGVVQLALVAICLAHLIVTILVYKSLTGEANLKDDNFFFFVIVVQSIIGIAIAVSSESVLKRTEEKARVDQ
jgi:hypothetical protein